ncbi:MAG: hypothetical protein HQM11_07780 [SAR324 cluster bacterium]|nr:hypothetical protein [SAR324 cluster bacterium]
MKVIVNDRRPFELEGTPAEVVNGLRKTAWMVEPSKIEYMDAVRHRVLITKERIIRNSSFLDFLEDIESLGLLTILKER